MTTYSDLQTRIITETTRDDLSDVLAAQLTLHIARAIEYYAPHRFWFNEGILSGACVAGNAYATVPTTMRTLDRVSVLVGGNPFNLKPRSLVWIDDMSFTGQSGQPTDYAQVTVDGTQKLRLWAVPTSAFALSFIGIVDLSPLASPADTNDWLGPGYDLITNRAKFTLYRDQFKDTTGMQLAAAAEADALSRLSGETARRLGTGRMRAHG